MSIFPPVVTGEAARSKQEELRWFIKHIPITERFFAPIRPHLSAMPTEATLYFFPIFRTDKNIPSDDVR